MFETSRTCACGIQPRSVQQQVQLLLDVLEGLVQKTKDSVIFRLLGVFLLCSHLLLSWGNSGGAGRLPSGTASAAGAGPSATTPQMKLPMLTLAKALANKSDHKVQHWHQLLWWGHWSSPLRHHLVLAVVVQDKGECKEFKDEGHVTNCPHSCRSQDEDFTPTWP